MDQSQSIGDRVKWMENGHRVYGTLVAMDAPANPPQDPNTPPVEQDGTVYTVILD
jgi:hypothetical protein